MIRFYEPQNKNSKTRILSLSVQHSKNYTPSDIMLMCAADMCYETGRTNYGRLYVIIDGARHFYDYWEINAIDPTTDQVIIYLTTSDCTSNESQPSSISFNPDWSKTEILDLVRDNKSCKTAHHVDLRRLCVVESSNRSVNRDWDELAFVVPTNWLIKCVNKLFNVRPYELYDWLVNTYSSEENKQIFVAALSEQQIIMIDFK